MFTGQLPKHISPRKLAYQEATLEGVLPVSECSRLCDVLAEDQSDIRVSLQFGVDEQRRPLIQGELKGTVGMTCQRCLDVVDIQVVASLNVAVVRNEEQAANLPASLDPLIVEDEAIDLRPFLEEELLLNLPIVPYHENETCHSGLAAYSTAGEDDGAAAEDVDDAPRPNPFSVLAGLKTGR